jgi:hypothetical protein
MNKSVSEKQLINLFSIFSLLIAAWIIYGLHGGVDEDGVLYLEVAKHFAAGDYQGGFELYNWAFFPWLISATHLAIGLSLQYSAHLLEALFFALTTWALLKLIHEGGGTKLTLVVGAILLFSSEYLVGHVLSWIMRDQGFWAFYLLGLLYFFRFYQFKQLKNAIMWQVTMLMAVLFRVEAISFLLFLPFSLLLKSDLSFRSRFKMLAEAYYINLIVITSALIIFLFNITYQYSDAFGRVNELQTRVIDVYFQITTGISQKADIFGKEILNKYTEDYAIHGIWMTLIIIIIAKAVSATGILTTSLAIAGINNQQIHIQLRTIFFWTAFINLLNATVALLSTFVLVERYLIGLTLLLIVFAAFSLSSFIQKISLTKIANINLRYKVVACLIILLIINGFYKNFRLSDPSKDYRQAATTWIKQHTQANDQVFYSDARLRYYAEVPWQGREQDWSLFIDTINNRPEPYEWLVLVIKGDLAEKQVPLLKKFKDYSIAKKCTNQGRSFIVIMKHQPA